MDQRLLRPRFDQLDEGEKRGLMEDVAARTGMAFQRLETFSHWGWGVTTGVFEKDGAQFVFVPGDTVTIGWERFAEGMDEDTREDIQQDLACYPYEGSVEDYLHEVMAPVQQVRVGPLLAERTLQEIGWERVEEDDPRFTAHPDWVREFEKFTRSDLVSLNLVGCARFDRVGEGRRVCLYHDVAHEELLALLQRGGYTLPTAAEWAYLSGGGRRTVYPWGDSFDYDMNCPYNLSSEAKKPYTMELPNGFGLSIAYDPYKQEVTEDGLLCGGDGGCGLCGGAGLALGFLPCSPHYQPEEILEGELNIDYNFYRRIVRIPDMEI